MRYWPFDVQFPVNPDADDSRVIHAMELRPIPGRWMPRKTASEWQAVSNFEAVSFFIGLHMSHYTHSLRGSLDHRHDAGADRFGKSIPCVDDGGQLRVCLTSVGGH
jgi:hypothetical protein